jgi:hypothetical protein
MNADSFCGWRSHGIRQLSGWPVRSLRHSRGPQRQPVRRECLDHVLVFGERHLRRVLSAYAGYYNRARPHRSLHKNSPLQRAIQQIGAIVVTPPSLADFTINTSAYDFRKGQVNRAIETIGRIMPVPILGGFHREYVQI